MTNIALHLGSALIAFGPLIALFSSIVYSKAQLVIVVTSSAFFFLMSTVIASFFWWIFYEVGLRGPLAGIIPGVMAQFAFRCWFVSVYHRVEQAIQQSVQQQEEKDAQQQQRNNSTTANQAVAPAMNRPSGDGLRQSSRTEGAESTNDDDNHNNYSSTNNHQTTANNNNNNQDKASWTEVAKLRLQLNDASCGIAAGVGFGGMHAILLYGTLLASEVTNNVGVLYQDSCPGMPSLVVSAIYAFCFSILDIFFMLLTFFGMRRRLMYHRGERPAPHLVSDYEGQAGAILGSTREGGNLALSSVLFAHFAASILTTADYFHYGCMVSLPASGVVVLAVAYWFWAGIGRIYMPPQETGEEESIVVSHNYNQHQD